MDRRYDDGGHPRGYGDERNMRSGREGGPDRGRMTTSRDDERGMPRHGRRDTAGDQYERRQDDRRRNYRHMDESHIRGDWSSAPDYERGRYDQRNEFYSRGDRPDLSGYDPEDLRGSRHRDNDRNGRGLEGESRHRDHRRDRLESHMDDDRHRRERESTRGEYGHHDDRAHRDRSFDGRREHGEQRHYGERHDSDRVRQDQGRSIGGGRDGWRVQERDPNRERIERAGRDTEYRNDWSYDGPRYTRGGREADPEDFSEYKGRDAGFSWRDGSNPTTWGDQDRWGNDYSNHSRREGIGYNRGGSRNPNFLSSPDRER
jgi:hypothetical protein